MDRPRFDITVTLGTRTAVLAIAELTVPARKEILRLALRRLRVIHGGLGGDTRVGSVEDPNENDRYINSFSESFPEGKEEGSGEKPRGGHADHDVIHIRAQYLADTLADPSSYAWYRIVAQHVPAGVIDKALAKARDVPASQLRKSRAAYFTALVRRHVQSTRP